MNQLLTPQINKQQIKETLINFLVPLICLIATGALVLIIIYPSFTSVPKLKSDLEQKQALKQTLTTKNLLLKKYVDFKSILDEDSQLIDKVLVSEANVPQLLDQVNQICIASGLKVSRLSYSYGDVGDTKEGEQPNKKVNISLGSEGSYDQLILFLKSSESAARIIYATAFRYALDTTSKSLYSNFSIESPYLFVQSNAVTDDPLALDITSSGFLSFIGRLKGLKYYEFMNTGAVAQEVKEATQSTAAPGNKATP